jgi:Clr5 domain
MQHEYDYHREYLEWRCVFQTCPTDTVAYLSEDDLRAHMVDHHHVSLTGDSEFLVIAKTCRRVVASRTDANIDCPVCLLSIPNKRSKIGRHLGRHMEDIALPIISLVVPTDDDTDVSDISDEQTSSNNEKPPLDPLFASDDRSPCDFTERRTSTQQNPERIPFIKRWELLKSEIEQLYIKENLPLREIVGVMREKYDFDAE